MIRMEVGKGPRSLLPAVLVLLVSSLPTGVTAGDEGAGVFIQLETVLSTLFSIVSTLP